MKMLALRHSFVRRPLQWWAWPLLLATFAGGACKPREKVCETEKFFRVLQPPPDAGMPFSIDPLGPELTGYVVIDKPVVLVFKDHDRVRLEWFYIDHETYGSIIYSEKEGLARHASGEGPVYPMRRLTGLFSERIHFGFRSFSCPGTEFLDPCPQEEIYLVADMRCTWQPRDD